MSTFSALEEFSDRNVFCIQPSQVGEMGREEPSEIQQRQIQGPVPGEE